MASYDRLTLDQELEELRISQASFEIHTKLSNTLISMIKRTSGSLLLRTMLRQSLELASQVSKADESSMFWLDEHGLVTESILARGATIREEKYDVIGTVLDAGLAGWVYRNQTTGLAEDVTTDERWVKLDDEPYHVGSVLCLPIIRGKGIMAIITLMHSRTGFFTPTIAKQMELCADKIGMVLDQMNFYLTNFQANNQGNLNGGNQLSRSTEQNNNGTLTNQRGICLLNKDGKLVYADDDFAHTFGYSIGELFELQSINSLIVQSHREQFMTGLNDCFDQGSIKKKFDVRFKAVTKNKQLLKVGLSGRPTKLYGKYLLIGVLGVSPNSDLPSARN